MPRAGGSVAVPEELARRGDLALVRSSTSSHAGLYRGAGDELRPAGALDFAEWRWVLVCVAPLAVQVLGPDPTYELLPTGPVAEPEQTPLDVKA